jgi:DNA-binding response OmpR family regulator
MKALIIEDEDILAKVLAEKLEKSNFDVKIAGDGEEAIKLSRSFNPDVIVLDLILPKIDGFGVLKDIKANENTKRIPVVVVSNLAEDENIKKAIKMGAADYMVKSNHPINEIADTIKDVLTDPLKYANNSKVC